MITGQWLTVQDVAQLLHVRIETVRRWIRQGELPVLELGSPRTVYRVRPADLDQFVWQRYRGKEQPDDTGPPGNSTELESHPGAVTDEQQQFPGPLPEGADLREIIDHVPAVTFRERPDRAASPAYMSHAVEQMLGYPARMWCSDPDAWLNHVHPDDRALVETGLARRSASRGPYRQEYRMIAADGRVVWISVDAATVPDESGDGSVWEGVIVDVTDRKHMESALGIRQRQQRAVADLGVRALEGDPLNDLLERSVQYARESLNVEYSRIFEVLPGGESLVLRAEVGRDEAAGGAPGSRPPGDVGRVVVSVNDESQSGYTLLAREPVVAEDLSAETRFDGPEMVAQFGVRSGITVAIPGRGRPYGVIGAYSARQRSYSQEDVFFLKAVANVIASAVARSDQRWLTVLDVADHLQVTEDTVRRWIRRNELPALNLGGPRAGYRVYPSDLERFINERVYRM